MALVLTQRSVKGSALSWADMDNNWQLIMNAINGASGAVKLYQIVELNALNQCQVDKSNNLLITGAVKILNALNTNPNLKYVITLNGVIAAAGQSDQYFIGQAFPFVANTTGGEFFNEQILINAYPATIAIYLWDENGNYAQSQQLVIQNNPCLAPAESIVLNSGMFVGGTLTLNLTATNGSNDYKAQYNNAGTWTDLGTFTHVDGIFNAVLNVSGVTGAYEVRVVDTLTNNISNQVDVNFA